MLVEDDALVSVEAACAVLSPMLLTVSLPSEVALVAVDSGVVGLAVVDVELDACVLLTVVDSTRTDAGKRLITSPIVHSRLVCLRGPADEEVCCVVVLVAEDALVSVEAAWLVLTPTLLTSSVPCDDSDEVPIVVVEEDVIGPVVVDPELDACVSLTVVVSGNVRRD